MLYGRKRVSGMVAEVYYQVKSGNSIWMMARVRLKRLTSPYFIVLAPLTRFNTMRVGPFLNLKKLWLIETELVS